MLTEKAYVIDTDSGGESSVIASTSGSSSSASASATGPGATSTATATATGGGSSATAEARSLPGNGPFVLVSADGGTEADAVAVAPQLCTDESTETLAMLPDV